MAIPHNSGGGKGARAAKGGGGGGPAVATPTLAPGRGTTARAIVNAAVREGRQVGGAAGIYSAIPNAGNNKVVLRGATPREQARRQKLVNMLNTYERTFASVATKNPSFNESTIHGRALSASGLTGDGLMNARGFAGKKVSSKPGVFFPNTR